MVVNNSLDKLISLGFTEYEGKTYLALLETNPATAYEIARTAGIPTSKIYQVVEKLKSKGFVQLIKEEGKKRYIPLEPDELISSYRKKVDTTLTSLKKDLSSIKTDKDISYIWNLKTYDSLLDKAERIINETKKELLVSAWKEDIAQLTPVLLKCSKRKVNIAIVHFGTPEIKIGQIFQHPIEDTIYSEKGGRGIVIVGDSKEALMGTVIKNKKVEGAWSMNKGFVTLAEDYIKHDIYIMKIVKRFNQTLIDKFGKGYKELRNIFSDTEVNK